MKSKNHKLKKKDLGIGGGAKYSCKREKRGKGGANKATAESAEDRHDSTVRKNRSGGRIEKRKKSINEGALPGKGFHNP